MKPETSREWKADKIRSPDRHKMQYTGSSKAHNQNVKRKYAKQIIDTAPSTIIHQTSHRKCESLSSESDISSVQIQLRNKLNQNRNNVHSGYVKRKVRRSCAWGTVLLVLISLVVKSEVVIGALALNYNSVNYFENSSYAALQDGDDSDIVPFLVDDDALLTFHRPSSRPSVYYQNEFAVFIPDGLERANRIAEKHGFTNMGQVRSDHYLNGIQVTSHSARIINLMGLDVT